jgi:hypothetical protein
VRRYVWLKAKGYAEPTGITQLMKVASDKVVAGKGPFQLTQDAEPLGEPAERAEVLKRFKTAITGREIGSVFRIRKGTGDVVFVARAIQAISQADSTNGNDRSDSYYNWVKAEYNKFSPRYAGSYVCRDIAGSSTLSQHSYGNAVDFFFDSMTHQTAVANAVIANAALLHPVHVISGSRIWTRGGGWSSYSGEYHSHLHVDFDPNYSGSCGVRG